MCYLVITPLCGLELPQLKQHTVEHVVDLLQAHLVTGSTVRGRGRGKGRGGDHRRRARARARVSARVSTKVRIRVAEGSDATSLPMAWHAGVRAPTPRPTASLVGMMRWPGNVASLVASLAQEQQEGRLGSLEGRLLGVKLAGALG
jgi:hypothetical protein